MIVCPNCNHPNPDGAVQCEACYTPLPATSACPNCGANIQSDASFCGQCGFNLRAAGFTSTPVEADNVSLPDVAPAIAETPASVPELSFPDPPAQQPLIFVPSVLAEKIEPRPDLSATPPPAAVSSVEPLRSIEPFNSVEQAAPADDNPIAVPSETSTQLQKQTAKLLHVQTNTTAELPQGLAVIHIGKPNDRIPPDVDVSGFPNSEVVSRIHADIRLEGDSYYIEDVGSSNGTYINNLPLAMGNRHRLRPGDRIGLGKGDKVTFLFQLS
ncbi:FHA domain-containing protein [Phormidium sp. CLA17]|uniref:FHA domain-containing protein n=1 Tax=Leptolyngbya sp. Cla-17 TaxID=2803751 RepID=UPI001491DF2E|nr:FHA domain-containing protein [Leptolyngbya sp. Cla-17]MBM0741195.1 FHA domain-containing protein [Leptolyngbya sp. Cla-17]